MEVREILPRDVNMCEDDNKTWSITITVVLHVIKQHYY